MKSAEETDIVQQAVKADTAADNRKNKKPFIKKITAILNSTSVFRIVFFAVMYADIRYLSYNIYYAIMLVTLAWAVGLFIKRYIIEKCIFRVSYRRIIYVFLGSGTFTVLLHSERNLFENIVTMLWLAICLFMFFGIGAEKSNIRLKKELRLLFDLIVFVTMPVMLAGLILFAIFPNGVELMGFEFCIHEGRFVGIIPNANVTAFYSVIAVVLCVFLLRMRKSDNTLKTKWKIWYIASIAVNFFTIMLTDSNATLLFVIFFIGFLFFYYIFMDYTRHKRHTFIIRLLAVLIGLAVISASLLLIRTGIEDGLSAVMTASERAEAPKSSVNNAQIVKDYENTLLTDMSAADTADKAKNKTDDDEESVSLGHKNKNIDSGRFVLWRQSLGLIEKYPLFGIGKGNITDYGLEYLGGIKYTNLGGYKYVDFHNGLITITVSFGFVGLGIFLVFAITAAKDILKGIFRYKKRIRRDGGMLVLIAAFCVAYCVYSMFEAALLVDYTYRVFIFWLILGFGMSYVKKYKLQDAHSDDEDKSADENDSLSHRIKTLFHRKKSSETAQENVRSEK